MLRAKRKKEENKIDEEGFVEVKSKEKKKKKERFVNEADEGEWITSENINDKLLDFNVNEEEENENKKRENKHCFNYN